MRAWSGQWKDTVASEELEAPGTGCRLGPAAHAELAQDVTHVALDSQRREGEVAGDRRIRCPGRKQAQHLELPCTQRLGQRTLLRLSRWRRLIHTRHG